MSLRASAIRSARGPRNVRRIRIGWHERCVPICDIVDELPEPECSLCPGWHRFQMLIPIRQSSFLKRPTRAVCDFAVGQSRATTGLSSKRGALFGRLESIPDRRGCARVMFNASRGALFDLTRRHRRLAWKDPSDNRVELFVSVRCPERVGYDAASERRSNA